VTIGTLKFSTLPGQGYGIRNTAPPAKVRSIVYRFSWSRWTKRWL